MFNFGYLPGSDKRITTCADSSLAALSAALQCLQPGGLLVAAVYGGHSEGAAEAPQIAAWAESLPQEAYRVLRYQFVNQRNTPPFLLAVEKQVDEMHPCLKKES